MSIDLANLTPAPWRASGALVDYADVHEDGVRVAKTYTSTFAPPVEEAVANARFIALARNAFDFWVQRDPKAALLWLTNPEEWYQEHAGNAP